MTLQNYAIDSLILRDRNFPYVDQDLAQEMMRITRDGFQKPVTIDDKGLVLAGALTVLAAKRLRRHYIPVKFSHLQVIK